VGQGRKALYSAALTQFTEPASGQGIAYRQGERKVFAMLTKLVGIAALALVGAMTPALAQETAQDPSISGNVWVAVAIIAVLVGVIWLLVAGSFGLEKRDAKLGRRDDDHGEGGIGMF